jgi:ubiquinone/menaquinone biosynthesis C-methylase UbiE
MSNVTEFYGRWAGLYDRIATAPGVGRWRRAAAEAVAEPGDTVVEMGCGTGANLPYLREEVGAGGRVVGIDITPELLEYARERTAEYDNVAVLRGDARRVPVAEADAVLATFVCGLFDEPKSVVEDWCEIVDGGGWIGLLDATASEAPLGRPLNPLFRAATAAGAPNTGIVDVLVAPFEAFDAPLSRRVATAREVVTDRTEDRSYETFALGFVGLLSGRVR